MKLFIQCLFVLACWNSARSQSAVHQIDSLCRTIYSANDPGAAIAVVDKGHVLFKKYYGTADLDKKTLIGPETRLNIGSVTKQFTAMAILQLIDKKKLSFSDKLIQFFPDFNPKQGNRITIQHLLTHSSGIIDHYDFADTKNLKHASDYDVLNAVKSLDTCYFEPGTAFRYSNTAYCLLSIIIEKVSGVPYAVYMNENIFGPIGMNHTVVLQQGKPIPEKALGYEINDSTKKFARADADESIFFSTQGDGGLYTTLDDYLRWFQVLQNGNMASTALLNKARSIQFPISQSNYLGYGYGWFIGKAGEDVVVSHTGSNGGFRAFVFTIPSKNYLLVIFSNRSGVDLEHLASEINKILRLYAKPFTKIESLTSFQDCCPIFAPCKKTALFSTSSIKSSNVKEMV